MGLRRANTTGDDNYIQLQIDDIAISLLKRGMTSDQIRDYMDFEAMRVESEIEDGELTSES